MQKKGLILVAVMLVIGALWYFDLAAWLSLEGMQAAQKKAGVLWEEDPVLLASAYVAIYVLATAVSFPGATLLTLAGGGIFGLFWGTVLVSFASTLGATLAMLVSRWLLRDWVTQRFAGTFDAVNRGIEKDGAFYLFGLRLVPLFPFFAVNLLMGLTRIRVPTYFWVSQLGMFPATVVYVNAGVELASLDSLAGLVSPSMLFAFTLLGVLPVATRKLLDVLRARRVYAGFRKPERFDANLIVIGAGAAGLVSSYIAAAVKAKVFLIEEHAMGGDCLNTGCVPSKSLLHAAKEVATARAAARYGVRAEGQPDFQAVMQDVKAAITAIEPHDSVARYTELGVDCITGRATLVSPWEVEVNGKRLSARAIVLATGAAPVVPDIPGLQQVHAVTSETVWQLEALPARLLVLGGGPIGCELALAFAQLGSKVTLVVRGQRVLAGEDADVCAMALRSLRDAGVDVRLNTTIAQFSDAQTAELETSGVCEKHIFDTLLLAVGRRARTTGFGLENLGIEVNDTITVDAFLRTRFPNIFVCGDAAGPFQFTHVAAHQAWYAAVNALFGQFRKFATDYSVIPRVTFLDPEVARVGINEQEAAVQGLQVEVTSYGVDDLDRAITERAAEGIVKIITAHGSDRILGVTIVAARAGEMLQPFVLAMKHNIGLRKLLGTIHPYPTWSEANKMAAGQWQRAHQPVAILRWVERYHAWRRG